MEKILSIQENATFTHADGYDAQYDGFIIKTDKQEIKVGISNEQQCCEAWGYVISEDDKEKFIGADLLEVYLTDTNLCGQEIDGMYEGDAMFINFNTSAGLFQLAVYNEHNGYYGHRAVIVSRELNHKDVL